ncbi:hypothetical protein [Streptomyces sp. G45]|uniref:hypothetical protein n=1 Tax=Streptomyces sp. G45 TaxID=3406627 RepID=UPI003C1A6DB2
MTPLLGLVAVCITLAVLALVAIYQALPCAHRAFEHPPDEGAVFRCYCYDRPILVTIAGRRTSRPERRGRHARPRAPPHANRR